jgi:iron complex outermembrane receptor protein
MNAIVTKDNSISVGSHLYQAPPQSANVWTTYELGSGPLQGAGAGIGVYYSDKREATLPNTFQLDSFTRLDASVFYRVNKHLKLSLNLKNLNDVRYYDSDGGYLFLQPGAPRTVMGAVSLDY